MRNPKVKEYMFLYLYCFKDKGRDHFGSSIFEVNAINWMTAGNEWIKYCLKNGYTEFQIEEVQW